MAKVQFEVEIDGLYDADEAAKALGLGVATIWRYIRDKKIGVMRLNGRTLVPQTEIDRIKADGEIGDSPNRGKRDE